MKHNVAIVNTPNKPMAMFMHRFSHTAEFTFDFGGGKSESNFKKFQLDPSAVSDWIEYMRCSYERGMPAKAVITFYGFTSKYFLIPKTGSKEEVEKTVDDIANTNYEKRLKACQKVLSNTVKATPLPEERLLVATPAQNVLCSIIKLKREQDLPSSYSYNTGNVKWRRLNSKTKFKFYHYFKAKSTCLLKNLVGTGVVPLPSLEGLSDVKAENKLYGNSFNNYCLGIKSPLLVTCPQGILPSSKSPLKSLLKVLSEESTVSLGPNTQLRRPHQPLCRSYSLHC